MAHSYSPRLSTISTSSAASSSSRSAGLGSPRGTRHQSKLSYSSINGGGTTLESGRTDSLIRKMKNWRVSHNSQLDFGCAGQDKSWLQDGPADLGDNTYSTHSRAHSSSSDISSSTVDSSLPPSPTPSCPSSFSTFTFPSPRMMPNTPRTEQRLGDEERAVEAAHDYIRRARLSKVEEDSSSALIGMGIDLSFDYQSDFVRSTFTPLVTSRSEERISPRSAPAARFSRSEPITPQSSYDSLRSTHSTRSTRPTRPSKSHLRPKITFLNPVEDRETPVYVPKLSPIPSTDAEITGVLEELSEFFSSTQVSNNSTPKQHSRSASHDVHNVRPVRRHFRSKYQSDGNIAFDGVALSAPMQSPKSYSNRVVERRVHYDWI